MPGAHLLAPAVPVVNSACCACPACHHLDVWAAWAVHHYLRDRCARALLPACFPCASILACRSCLPVAPPSLVSLETKVLPATLLLLSALNSMIPPFALSTQMIASAWGATQGAPPG